MYAIAGPSPLQGFTSEARAISDAGVVVGILHPASGLRTRAFVWDGALTILPDRGFAAEARAISASGEIAGAVELQPGRLAAAVWNSTHQLTLLQAPAGAVTSFAHGLDRQGHIVGGCVIPGPRQLPLFWPSATAAPQPCPLGSQWAEALAIN